MRLAASETQLFTLDQATGSLVALPVVTVGALDMHQFQVCEGTAVTPLRFSSSLSFTTICYGVCVFVLQLPLATYCAC